MPNLSASSSSPRRSGAATRSRGLPSSRTSTAGSCARIEGLVKLEQEIRRRHPELLGLRHPGKAGQKRGRWRPVPCSPSRPLIPTDLLQRQRDASARPLPSRDCRRGRGGDPSPAPGAGIEPVYKMVIPAPPSSRQDTVSSTAPWAESGIPRGSGRRNRYREPGTWNFEAAQAAIVIRWADRISQGLKFDYCSVLGVGAPRAGWSVIINNNPGRSRLS